MGNIAKKHHNKFDPDTRRNVEALGLSYTIPDYYRSDIKLRHFPVLSDLRTFHSFSFCSILLYYHNFVYEMHLEIPKFDVAPIAIRYRVTGVLVLFVWVLYISVNFCTYINSIDYACLR